MRQISTDSRSTQRNRLLELLKRGAPDWVPIREVIEVVGFQYGARILELRRLGHRIQNDPGRAFRLLQVLTQQQPAQRGQESEQKRETAAVVPLSLFGDLAPLHKDLG